MSSPVAVLVNPAAGRGRTARVAAPVVRQFESSGLTVRYLAGRDGGEAADLALTAVASGVRAVIAVGGDGLVNLALQAVACTATPLGIVATGSGNDIARTLGLPVGNPLTSAALAARCLVAGQQRTVDAGRCDRRWFLGVLGAGFDSLVNQRASRMRWPQGRSRYDLAIAAELRRLRPITFTLELDGRREVRPAMLVAVGNGASYGGGMLVTPAARLDDGLLDVMILGPVSRTEFLRVFPRVYRGTHVEHPAVEVRQVRHLRLAADGVIAYADGERVGPLPASCQAVPDAVHVLAPPVP
jgi:diacylglycerol kinase (ATP)